MRGHPVLNPVKSSHGAIHHVNNRLHTAVAHPPMLIAWASRFRSFSSAESHQSVRLRAAGVRTLLFFGNQIDLVHEEVRVGVCTDLFAPFFCLQEGRA